MAEQPDPTRKYTPSAGACDKCGFFKTWEFRVLNPKTGKQVPGHINSEGHAIGNGECPFYAKKGKPAQETAREVFDLPKETASTGATISVSDGTMKALLTEIQAMSSRLQRMDATMDSIAISTRNVSDDTNRIFKLLDVKFDQLTSRVAVLQKPDPAGGAP